MAWLISKVLSSSEVGPWTSVQLCKGQASLHSSPRLLPRLLLPQFRLNDAGILPIQREAVKCFMDVIYTTEEVS